MANIDVTYGDEPKPLSKEETAKLLKLYEEQQQRMQGEGEDLLNFQEVIVLIDEDEDAENLRRLRAAACEKFAKEQLEKKLEKQRRYQQERMKRQKGKISSDEEDVDVLFKGKHREFAADVAWRRRQRRERREAATE